MKKQEPFPDLSADLIQFLADHKDKTTASASERVLQNFTKAHLGHEDYDAVSIKATLLNMFYATGIQAIELMAKNIYSIENIDEVLAQEKYSSELVNRIALLKFGEGKKDRNNYSFATKYCALHQPEKYPIYDSIVAGFFTGLMTSNEGLLPPYALKKKYSEPSTLTYMTQGEFQEALRNYDFFVRVYDRFMELYGLKKDGITYRDVDWYIWASYKTPEFESELEKMVKLKDVYEWEDNTKDIQRTKLTQTKFPSDSELLKALQKMWIKA